MLLGGLELHSQQTENCTDNPPKLQGARQQTKEKKWTGITALLFQEYNTIHI